MFKTIKNLLYEDSNQIVKVLESLGCHNIDVKNSEIKCALPDGDNVRSVHISLNEYLTTKVYTRSEFGNYEIKDFITFVSFILQEELMSKALKYICSCVGVEYEGENIIKKQNIGGLKTIKTFSRKNTTVCNRIMQEEYLRNYPLYIVTEWVQEGITPESQNKFGVRIDRNKSRWIFPLRNELGQLTNIKGRTFAPQYDKLGIPKYIYYHKSMFDNEYKYIHNIPFGLYENKDEIKKQGMVILFEAEKSVMKADSFGFKNTLSVGKKGVNEHMFKEILRLQCDVVFAYDKDVKYEEILIDINKFKKYVNVYVIFDNENKLGEKDAPVDKGIETWIELYNNRRRVA